MVDISNLTYEELNELEKKIRAAKKAYGSVCKSDLLSYEERHKVIKSFTHNKPDGFSDSYEYSLHNLMEASAAMICDLVLGNFKLKKASANTSSYHKVSNKDNTKEYKIVRNGSYILTNITDYKAMYVELMNLCIDYSEKSAPIEVDK